MVERRAPPRIDAIAQGLGLPVGEPAVERRRRTRAQTIVEQLAECDGTAAGLEPLVELRVAGLEDRRGGRPGRVDAQRARRNRPCRQRGTADLVDLAPE